MALEVKKAGTKEYGRWIKALFCGDPGSGKTRTASTWPDPLYVNAEGGLMSVADRQVAFVTIERASQIAELKSMLDQTPEVREQMLGVPVQTVIIDTIDEMARILVRERLETQRKETMAIPDWGWLGDQLRLMVRTYRNLDLNLIVNCHLKTQEDENGMFVKPGIQGGFADEIAGFVDLALMLTARPVPKVDADGNTTKELVRVLQTFPDNRHPWIKDRSGKLPMEFPINFEDDHARLDALVYGNIADLEETETLTQIATPQAAPEPEPAKKTGKAKAKAAPAPKAKTKAEKAAQDDEAQPTLEETTAPEPDASPAEGDPPAEAPTAVQEEETSSDEPVEDPPAPEPDAEPEAPAEPEAEAEPEPEPQEAAEPAQESADDVEPDSAEDADAPTESGDEETVPASGTDAPDDMACSGCQKPIETVDQRDLSMIRYREPLCRTCFAAKKAGK